MDPLSILIGTWLAILSGTAYYALRRRPIVEPEPRQGPPSDHEIRLVKLETKTKALNDEWENKLVQYDTLVRRLVRMKVMTEKAAEALKGDGEDQPGAGPPLTRAQLYARWRAGRAK